MTPVFDTTIRAILSGDRLTLRFASGVSLTAEGNVKPLILQSPMGTTKQMAPALFGQTLARLVSEEARLHQLKQEERPPLGAQPLVTPSNKDGAVEDKP